MYRYTCHVYALSGRCLDDSYCLDIRLSLTAYVGQLRLYMYEPTPTKF